MRKPVVLIVVSVFAMLLSMWSQGELAGTLVGGSDGMPEIAKFFFALLGASAGIGLVVGLFWVAWVWLMGSFFDDSPDESS